MFPKNKHEKAFLNACGKLWGDAGFSSLRWEDVEGGYKAGLTANQTMEPQIKSTQRVKMHITNSRRIK